MTQVRTLSAALTTGALALSLAACGSSNDSSTTASAQSPMPSSSSAPMATPSDSAMASPSTSAADAGAPFGAGCASVPATGAGSFNGMATAPVATAASANPVLSTLVTAVKKAGLVDTLNSAKDITVFAPSNDAFKKIPAATLAKVLADKATLTKILTYHVVGKTVSPSELGTAGPFTSLEGAKVTAKGSGSDFTVNGAAKVVCGGVKTANATVYIIDSVLMPPAA